MRDEEKNRSFLALISLVALVACSKDNTEVIAEDVVQDTLSDSIQEDETKEETEKIQTDETAAKDDSVTNDEAIADNEKTDEAIADNEKTDEAIADNEKTDGAVEDNQESAQGKLRFDGLYCYYGKNDGLTILYAIRFFPTGEITTVSMDCSDRQMPREEWTLPTSGDFTAKGTWTMEGDNITFSTYVPDLDGTGEVIVDYD